MKHTCKFCSKSFPCGRSLGGHMRSHVINSAETDEKKLNKNQLLSLNNDKTDTNYGLRENPKKKFRFANLSEESTLLHDKLCKECGKGFQSWKALFGHMKCHSEKFSISNSLDEDSWTSSNQKLAIDNQSENETAAAPNRRKRSKRIKRYSATTTTTTTSDFSIANTSSVCEIEQEQEEVAMCLIMLSKDVGNWGDMNSDFIVTRIGGKSSLCHRNGNLENSNLDSENIKSDKKQSEFCSSRVPRVEPKKYKSEIPVDGFFEKEKLKNFEMDDEYAIRVYEVDMGKNVVNGTGLDQAELRTKKHKSRKRKGFDLFDSCEMYKENEKKSKFECTTCNKAFHSYQALGGHRASHQKMRGCFGSKIDSSENSIEIEISPDKNEPTDCKMVAIYTEKGETSHGLKRNKEHECPICFKVFSSGQALGGHKRSHLIAEAKSNRKVVIQKPVPEIRDFLDLNLPAPDEEDSSNGNVGFNPWWIGSNQKRESFVGLLSN